MIADTIEARSSERTIRFGNNSFAYYVHSGSDPASQLPQHLVDLDADRFIIITETGVPAELVKRVSEAIGTVAPCDVVRLVAGERAKTLRSVSDLAGQALEAGATRRSCIVAMGGGLIGNVGGLLAALLFRGIRLIHVPTTLLAMTDSVLSLKQAVNSGLGKNHLGTFYAPELVWNDLRNLESLPRDEIRSALCEMSKNILAISPGRYDDIVNLLRPDACYTDEAYLRFIEVCVDAKSAVMRHDPHESGVGLVLEYGHTAGHAIEHVTAGGVRHGFAVGLGMLVAARVARELGYLDAHAEEAHYELLARAGAPTAFPNDLDIDQVLDAMRHDNKRGYLRSSAGMCDMVLLRALGVPVTNERLLPITHVPGDVVRTGLLGMRRERYAVISHG